MHALYSPCTRRMGLHQRHIGMTGTMNSLALYSLTQYLLILFQCTHHTISLFLSNARTHLSHFSSTSVCVCVCVGGGGGGDGKGALHVG